MKTSGAQFEPVRFRYKKDGKRYVVLKVHLAQWLSWLERRPVTAEVVSSSLIWVVSFLLTELVNCINGVLAQLGEHLPYKQRVIGSSPIGPIDYGWIPEWPKGADCKSVGTAFEGSNPSLPSIIRLFLVIKNK